MVVVVVLEAPSSLKPSDHQLELCRVQQSGGGGGSSGGGGDGGSGGWGGAGGPPARAPAQVTCSVQPTMVHHHRWREEARSISTRDVTRLGRVLGWFAPRVFWRENSNFLRSFSSNFSQIHKSTRERNNNFKIISRGWLNYGDVARL